MSIMKMLLNILKISIFFMTFVKCKESPSVLILGAGPAGIAAASRLLENNIENITILEASDRIGGRIRSVEFGDGIVDLGAQWCHGEQNNTVYKLVKDLDLLEFDDRQTNVFYSTGAAIDKTMKKEIFKIFENLYYKYPGNTTVGEDLTKRYTEIVRHLYKYNQKKLEIALDALNYFLSFTASVDGAFSAFDIASQSDYITCEGENLSWKNTGYQIILDVLMKKYPNPENELPVMNKIEFNKEVLEITWNGDRANVICLDGSQYEADHVIVTFSLGVLKHSHETLFNPSLPIKKIDAIQELGFGAISKIFLRFPNRWWGKDDFSFIWSENDRKSFANSTTSEEDNVWLLDMIDLIEVKGNPNVLIAWFAGSSIPTIELLNDEEVIEGIMLVLHKFLGKTSTKIAPPDAILRHNWYSDPYFRGTYSFQTLASNKRCISPEVTLSEPLKSENGKQTLLFAGEATHPHFYSTVHGAIETGQREADRIINQGGERYHPFFN